MDSAPCVADVTSAWNECVNVSVPTTISSKHASTFWDLGFERLRLKVSAPLTLRRMRLRGIVSAKQPVIHFMFFPGDAGLVCEGCVVEFSCRGLGVEYFNEVLPPVRAPYYCYSCFLWRVVGERVYVYPFNPCVSSVHT